MEDFDTSFSVREIIKDKLRQNFDGKIVRKDLTKKIKEGANVPTYVLEFLLGQYCSSDDDEIKSDTETPTKSAKTETTRSTKKNSDNDDADALVKGGASGIIIIVAIIAFAAMVMGVSVLVFIYKIIKLKYDNKDKK